MYVFLKICKEKIFFIDIWIFNFREFLSGNCNNEGNIDNIRGEVENQCKSGGFSYTLDYITSPGKYYRKDAG